MFNGEDHLDDCLSSIRRQRYRRIEIVVVDDGSTDGTADIVRAHAAEDRRVRLVQRPNGGLSAARNTGLAAATGEFVTYVDGDDEVTAEGLAAAMTSLRATGSDVAVLEYGRLDDEGTRPGAPWIRRLHRVARPKVTLAECPDVLVNATAWGKVFRRDFHDRAGLRFVEGVIYEDQAFTAQAYAQARSIDVLDVTGYLWRVNESSMSQGQVTAANLRGRLRAAHDALAALEAHPAARAERALQQLRYNLTNSALKLERADEEYLDVFIEGLPPILAAAPADRYAAEVPAEFRVVYALIAGGHREAVWRFVRAEGMQPQMHRSGPEPAGWTVYLPGWGSDPIPPETYVGTGSQLRPQVVVRSAWAEGAALVVAVDAWVPTVDLASVPPTLSASVDGTELRVEADPSAPPVEVTSRQGACRRYPLARWRVLGIPATSRGVDLRLEFSAGPFSRTVTRKVRP